MSLLNLCYYILLYNDDIIGKTLIVDFLTMYINSILDICSWNYSFDLHLIKRWIVETRVLREGPTIKPHNRGGGLENNYMLNPTLMTKNNLYKERITYF